MDACGVFAAGWLVLATMHMPGSMVPSLDVGDVSSAALYDA